MNRIIGASRINIRIIVIVSIMVPLLVAVLLFSPVHFDVSDQSWVRSLPGFNALINSVTTVILLLALLAVRSARYVLHKNLMTTAFLLGTFFLISYITYHASAPSTIFGDLDHNGVLSPSEQQSIGPLRGVYLFTLLSHIVLSIAVVPLVLLAFFYSLSGRLDRHKKIVRFAFPVWLYVSITGVLVYLMISPYYL